jgi:hypothetical protein
MSLKQTVRGMKGQEAGENCIMRIRREGHVACMGAMRNVYRNFIGKPEGKRPLRRSRHRLADNIKKDFREIAFRGMDWIHVAQNRE